MKRFRRHDFRGGPSAPHAPAMRAFGHRCTLLLLLALLGGHPFPAPAAELGKARDLATEGRLSDALAVVDSVLADRPEDVSALLLRGVILSRAGRSDEAIDAFNAIAAARPDLPEPHNNLAVLYAAQGRYDEARGALVEAIRLQPDYALAHENLGDVYAKLAALSYARASQIDPGNADAADKSIAAEGLIGGGGDAVPVATPGTATQAPATETQVAPGRPPATMAPAAADADSACVQVKGVSPPARAEGVVRWFRQRGMQAEQTAGATAAPARAAYRVYIPSLGNASAARARIAELREAGISDLIMITDADELHGISLGVFRQRESAERRARQLQDRGIETRIAELATSRPTAASVAARGAFRPADFARAYPDLLPEIVDCP